MEIHALTPTLARFYIVPVLSRVLRTRISFSPPFVLAGAYDLARDHVIAVIMDPYAVLEFPHHIL